MVLGSDSWQDLKSRASPLCFQVSIEVPGAVVRC